ncbi:hypothetical protein BC834DRAFT_546493 [Gloeopeniophorella convolvens]|nr:hypothetical protein BC834DRAFT_546493 [Gloeopeniophorella convolvens]
MAESKVVFISNSGLSRTAVLTPTCLDLDQLPTPSITPGRTTPGMRPTVAQWCFGLRIYIRPVPDSSFPNTALERDAQLSWKMDRDSNRKRRPRDAGGPVDDASPLRIQPSNLEGREPHHDAKQYTQPAYIGANPNAAYTGQLTPQIPRVSSVLYSGAAASTSFSQQSGLLYLSG